MRAGIIAAGDGSRLLAAGIATPKPLLPVAGVPLLERTVRALHAAGICELALIVNEAMAAAVAPFARALAGGLGISLALVTRTTPSSMHSLHELRPHLEGERFVLCAVDSILAPDELTSFVARFAEQGEVELYLGYTDFIDDEKPLHLRVADDGRVTALGAAAAGSPFVTAGLYGMSPRVFDPLARAVATGRERLRWFLGQLLEEGFVARGHRLGKVVDVDRPGDIAVAEELLRGVTSS